MAVKTPGCDFKTNIGVWQWCAATPHDLYRLKLQVKPTKNSIKPEVYYIRQLSLLFMPGGATTVAIII